MVKVRRTVVAGPPADGLADGANVPAEQHTGRLASSGQRRRRTLGPTAESDRFGGGEHASRNAAAEIGP